MPTQWFDWGQSGRGLGQALIGANNAYQHGFEGEMSKLGKAALMAAQSRAADAVARKNDEDASASQQRRQFQTPEFGNKIAASLAGLTEPQRMETDAYLNSGTWTKPLPVDVSGPPEPTTQAPGWAKPETMQRYNLGRAAHLVNLGATGNTNAEQIADAFAKLLGQGRIDNAMANPQTIPDFGATMAASQGKPLYTQGANGVMQLFTGDERINEVGKTAAQENRAQAANAYASAEKNRAGAALSRSKIDAAGGGRVITLADGTEIEIPGRPAKPMPSSALKLQQEEIDALSAATGLDKDLGAVLAQLDDGSLSLGLAKNLMSSGRNFVGASNENSRNYASFRATLERLRNESLRLNKGVQTEGDAQRAWNELVASINDPEVVKQRLNEIVRVNQRAAMLREQNINVIRSNFGNPPLDVTNYLKQAATLGPKLGAGETAGGAAPSNSAPQKLQRGQVMDGFRFKGGDPSNPASWEPVR